MRQIHSIIHRITLIVFVFIFPHIAFGDGDLSKPMRFSTFTPCAGNGSHCGVTILAEGTIEPDTAKKFIAYLLKIKANNPDLPRSPAVSFNSPGGNLSGGIKLGQTIRKLGLDTRISPTYSQVPTGTLYEKEFRDNVICASACVMAFAGGVNRYVQWGSQVGIHQFTGGEKSIDEGDAQVTVVAIAGHLESMGVNRNLLDMASLVPSNDMYWLADEEVKQLKLDNSETTGTNWTLEATENGEVYAHLIQELPGNRNLVTLLLNKEDGEYILTIIMDMSTKNQPVLNAALDALNNYSDNPGQGRLTLRIDANDSTTYSAEWIAVNDAAVGTAITLTRKDANNLKLGNRLHVQTSVARVNSEYDPTTVVSLDGLSKYLKTLK